MPPAIVQLVHNSKFPFHLVSLTRGPASFTSGELDLIRLVAGDVLDVLQGLEHVIEVGVGGVVKLLALPVREAIGEAICTSVNWHFWHSPLTYM